jgi:phage terminase large subunit-like protein
MKNDVRYVLENLSRVVEENFTLPDGRRVRLTPYQEEFIKKVLMREKKRHLFVASTRIGKTTAVCVLATLSAILYDGEEVTIVAPKFDQALHIFKTIRAFFFNNPKLMRFVNTSLGFRRDEINLLNGSVLRILTAGSPTGLLGYGATVLIVDEAASIPDEVFRTRILRMLAGQAGRAEPYVIMLSTPHSRNFFYDAYMSGRYEIYRVTWREGVKYGILDREWVEESRRMLSSQEFKVWFEAEFPETGSEVFSIEIVKRLAVGSRWDGPAEGYRYYMGLDVARLGVDESAIVILAVPEYLEGDEKATADVCYWTTKGRQTLTKVFKWASEVAERWRVEAIGVDVTGMGAGVGDLLAENFGNKVVQIEMVGNMRNDVYMNLQRLIEDERLRLPKEERFISQFSNFWIEYDKLGRPRVVKGVKGRDDLVDALAYACWAWRGGRRSRVAVFEELLRLGL